MAAFKCILLAILLVGICDAVMKMKHLPKPPHVDNDKMQPACKQVDATQGFAGSSVKYTVREDDLIKANQKTQKHADQQHDGFDEVEAYRRGRLQGYLDVAIFICILAIRRLYTFCRRKEVQLEPQFQGFEPEEEPQEDEEMKTPQNIQQPIHHI